jgi:hypothetical protein
MVVNAVLYENPSFIIVPAERFSYMVILPHSRISNETSNDAIYLNHDHPEVLA